MRATRHSGECAAGTAAVGAGGISRVRPEGTKGSDGPVRLVGAAGSEACAGCESRLGTRGRPGSSERGRAVEKAAR